VLPYLCFTKNQGTSLSTDPPTNKAASLCYSPLRGTNRGRGLPGFNCDGQGVFVSIVTI